MTRESAHLQPGTLWQRAVETTRRALESGALVSIPTSVSYLEEKSVRFVVRASSKVELKEKARIRQRQSRQAGLPANPFLPYDKELFVGNLSDTHVCLLNKFNVLDHHLLMVTRVYESQKAPLNADDFEAMWICLREFPSLVFYNSGEAAGASQRHKHFQCLPLPLSPEGPAIPMESLILSGPFKDTLGSPRALRFRHATALLDSALSREAPWTAAEATLEIYQNLLRETGSVGRPYNLLATTRWMFVAPRSRDCFENISINALGFAGSLFVRNKQELELLRKTGPMEILKRVAFAE